MELANAQLQAGKSNVFQLEASVKVAEANVTRANADLAQKKSSLDGFVTDWEIREGTYVTSIPLAAAGTFVETGATAIVASIPANYLTHVKPGQMVELAFKSEPGHLFLGKVDAMIQASGEGQFQTGGKLPSAASIGSPRFMAVRIKLDDPTKADELAMGMPGTVAIYTDHGKPFAMISKVAIRMQKWLYFLPLP